MADDPTVLDESPAGRVPTGPRLQNMPPRRRTLPPQYVDAANYLHQAEVAGRMVNIVHDEVLVDLNEETTLDDRERYKRFVEQVLNAPIPDVPIKTTPVVMKRWFREREQFRSETRQALADLLAAGPGATVVVHVEKGKLVSAVPVRVHSFKIATEYATCELCGEPTQARFYNYPYGLFAVFDRQRTRVPLHMRCATKSSFREARRSDRPNRHERKRLGLPRPAFVDGLRGAEE